jgi:organic hydroperoxide reductase OsmC/OhrA/uncharacterized damage-inducible protein DinB
MTSSQEPVNAYANFVPVTGTPDELINAYERCIDELVLAVQGLSLEELKARPIEGKWSTLEVVCHLADTEIYFTDRIERTIALDNPLLMGVDERPYPDKIQFQEQLLDEELELMAILRRRTARILRRQPESAWKRTAVHSGSGLCTLEDLVKKAIGHVQHHLPFIAEKRKALEANRTATRPPKESHAYRASIAWKNQGPDFVSGKYSREHTWSFDGGVSFAASSSPHVVPTPWSAESAVDPEEALVAAAASCHMLTFLWLASKRNWVVESYADNASGIMTKDLHRIPWVSEITLRPKITWSDTVTPDAAAIAELHQLAHEQCFIANSLKSKVIIES